MRSKHPFVNVAFAGISFQGGSGLIDSATIVSALIHQLTGSTILVGAVTAILRVGWLFPQLFVGFLAQRGGSSRRYYMIGAFGRAICVALIGCVLFFGADVPPLKLGFIVLVLWITYAFISGLVAVPYNDMVARAIPSNQRSRLLATRFFGGGLLALGAAALADRLITAYAFPISYSAVFGISAFLMFVSSFVFTAMGEPPRVNLNKEARTFMDYLRDGREVFRTDEQFRLYVYAQWCGGCVLMAMPFYVVHVGTLGFDLQRVALLLAAQTTGGLISNALWGWWGDKYGKGSLLSVVVFCRVFPPLIILVMPIFSIVDKELDITIYAGVFFLLGALANGLTIAVIGFLMEISPEEQRPAYSGYFNALTAPAYLLPLLGGLIASLGDITVVFVISVAAALGQWMLVAILTRRKPNNAA